MIVQLNSDVQVIPDPESDGALLVNQSSFIVARVNDTGRMILDLAEQHRSWDDAARELADAGACSIEYAAEVIRKYTDELTRAGWLVQQHPQEGERR